MKRYVALKIENKGPDFVDVLWNDGSNRRHRLGAFFHQWKANPILASLANPAGVQSIEVVDGSLGWPEEKIAVPSNINLEIEDDRLTLDPYTLYETGEVIVERNPALKLAQVVSSIRLKLGLTQEQVAIRTGVTKSYISKIERGVTDINLGTFEWLLEQGFGKRIEIVDIEPQQENTGDNQ